MRPEPDGSPGKYPSLLPGFKKKERGVTIDNVVDALKRDLLHRHSREEGFLQSSQIKLHLTPG